MTKTLSPEQFKLKVSEIKDLTRIKALNSSSIATQKVFMDTTTELRLRYNELYSYGYTDEQIHKEWARV